KLRKLPSRKRMLVGTCVRPVSLLSRTPLPLASKKVEVWILACHWFMASSPRLVVPPLSRTGVDSPSTRMSFHWSKTVILQSPLGRPDNVKCPAASHLVNAKSSPSGSPMLTEHWVKAKLSIVPLPYSRSSGVRLMRSVETKPVSVFVQPLPETFGSVPLHTPARRLLMIAGLAKPTDT